jgi:hypothetical protein
MLGRMRLEKVLGDIASWRWPILVAKSLHMGGGGNLDKLAYPLHRPMARSC